MNRRNLLQSLPLLGLGAKKAAEAATSGEIGATQTATAVRTSERLTRALRDLGHLPPIAKPIPESCGMSFKVPDWLQRSAYAAQSRYEEARWTRKPTTKERIRSVKERRMHIYRNKIYGSRDLYIKPLTVADHLQDLRNQLISQKETLCPRQSNQ